MSNSNHATAITNMKSIALTPNQFLSGKSKPFDFKAILLSDGEEDNQSLFEEEDFEDDIDIMLSNHTSLKRESQEIRFSFDNKRYFIQTGI